MKILLPEEGGTDNKLTKIPAVYSIYFSYYFIYHM